jgi:hypothetical protein
VKDIHVREKEERIFTAVLCFRFLMHLHCVKDWLSCCKFSPLFSAFGFSCTFIVLKIGCPAANFHRCSLLSQTPSLCGRSITLLLGITLHTACHCGLSVGVSRLCRLTRLMCYTVILCVQLWHTYETEREHGPLSIVHSWWHDACLTGTLIVHSKVLFTQ